MSAACTSVCTSNDASAAANALPAEDALTSTAGVLPAANAAAADAATTDAATANAAIVAAAIDDAASSHAESCARGGAPLPYEEEEPSVGNEPPSRLPIRRLVQAISQGRLIEG